MNAEIRQALVSDFPEITHVYNHYVENSISTLATELATLDEMITRWRELQAKALPWLVAVRNSSVVGFAYASPFKARLGYRHTLESTVYVAPESLGRGFGRQLYAALLDQARLEAAHCIIGALSLPNPASVRLHESMGFQKVAHLAEVGKKFGRWIDVGYWQRLQ